MLQAQRTPTVTATSCSWSAPLSWPPWCPLSCPSNCHWRSTRLCWHWPSCVSVPCGSVVEVVIKSRRTVLVRGNPSLLIIICCCWKLLLIFLLMVPFINWICTHTHTYAHPPPPPMHTHTHMHSHTHWHTHSQTHTHTTHACMHTLTHTLTHFLSLLLHIAECT